MNIKRENIPDIIKILQEKYDNSNPGDIIYDLKLTNNIKEDFIIPEHWRLPRTSNTHYWAVLENWITTKGNVLEGHIDGVGWRLNYAEAFEIHYHVKHKHFYGNQTKDGTEISWEDFIKYIAKV